MNHNHLKVPTLNALSIANKDGSASMSICSFGLYIGLVHPQLRCHGCLLEGIAGILWKCVRCFEYFLCTPCYAAGKHSVEHPFLRIDSEDLTKRLGDMMFFPP